MMKGFWIFSSLLCATAIRIPVTHQALVKEGFDLESTLAEYGFDVELLDGGQGEHLVNALQNAHITPAVFNKVMSESQGQGHGCSNSNLNGRIQTAVWLLAAKEDNLLGDDMGQSKISEFGRAIPKVPRSWVNNILALNHSKIHKYMFSGSFAKLNVHRKWLPGFVKSHFGPGDYFRATDALMKGNKFNHGKKYATLGEFDYSLVDQHGYNPKGEFPHHWNPEKSDYEAPFDKTYWTKMAESQFVVAPGGDAPYSFRFYESFLAGSIPIIHDYENDWKAQQCTSWVNMIGYEHKFVEQEHIFDQEMADRNLQKFLRYQTFLQGDNNPKDDGHSF